MAGVTLPASMSSRRHDQVGGVLRGDEGAELLAHERGQQDRPELAVGAAEPASVGLASDDDERPVGVRARRRCDSRRLPPMSRIDVVAVLAVGEVVAGVVDDVVGAERADQVDLGGAAHAGDLGAERLGDLHGERADASRRADDQHLLPGLDLRRGRARPGAR